MGNFSTVYNKESSRANDNSLIIVVKSPGYSLGSSVLCVAEKEAVHINDYMKALHQRFYREPDFSEMEEDIEKTRQEVRDWPYSWR